MVELPLSWRSMLIRKLKWRLKHDMLGSVRCLIRKRVSSDLIAMARDFLWRRTELTISITMEDKLRDYV